MANSRPSAIQIRRRAEAFELALALAKEKDADLVLATDPDADRLGVYVKDSKSGEYICLTGNMTGCLLADYEIGQKTGIGRQTAGRRLYGKNDRNDQSCQMPSRNIMALKL